MKKLGLFLIIAGAAYYTTLTTSCSKGNQATDTLSYEMKSLQQVYNNCTIDSPNCTYISYNYPLFVGKGAAVDSLNRIVMTVFGANEHITLLQTQQTFINAYAELIKTKHDSEQSWYSQTNITIPYQTNDLVCLSIETDDYTGGAHGIYSTFYNNFDKRTMQIVTMKKIFTDSALTVLKGIAEEQFRKTNEIAPTANLEELGYLFNDGKFYLNDNFTFTPDGITWLYNPYEIASYAQGTIELPISKEVLQSLVKDEFKKMWD